MKLYLHQQQARDFLAQHGTAYLADRPGLGKSRAAIAALFNSNVDRALIVCPAIVRTHWARELEEMGAAPDWAIIRSYDALVRGGKETMRELIKNEGVTHLVSDEAHYLKHATSQRTQTILGADGYARRMKGTILLSGTPVPKNPDEFRTVLFSLFPSVAVQYGVQTTEKYRAAFCDVRQRWVRGRMEDKILPVIRNASEFRAMLGEFMLQRGPGEVGLDVPRLDWQLLRLDAKETAEAHGDAEGWKRLRSAVQAGTPLSDLVEDPHVARIRRRLGELKVAPVAEMVASQLADNDDKIAIFAHHTSVLDGLEAMLSQYGVARVDGAVSETGRDHAMQRFTNEPKTRVFLGQSVACQTGMDGLQHATSRCILVEPSWSETENDQLGHRIARIGSNFGVAIAQMVALAGTLDEAIVKRNVAEAKMRAEIEMKV